MSETVARLIRASDCRCMPWKNGGGATTEIAVHPHDAGLADFEWRVSIATVQVVGATTRTTSAATLLWCCLGGRLRIQGPAGSATLGAGDAWLVEHQAPLDWHIEPQGVAELAMVTLQRVTSS